MPALLPLSFPSVTPAAVRSKLLPVLLEWDLQQEGRGEGEHGPAEGVEFRAVEVQKVHGLKSKIDELTGETLLYMCLTGAPVVPLLCVRQRLGLLLLAARPPACPSIALLAAQARTGATCCAGSGWTLMWRGWGSCRYGAVRCSSSAADGRVQTAASISSLALLWSCGAAPHAAVCPLAAGASQEAAGQARRRWVGGRRVRGRRGGGAQPGCQPVRQPAGRRQPRVDEPA